MPERNTGLTRPPKGWQDEFIRVLGLMCNVRFACESAQVSRRTAYRHRERSAAFARRWDEALEEARDRLRQEIWRRGVAGVDEPVFGTVVNASQQRVTDQVGTVRKYSDRLLENLARAHLPEFKEAIDVHVHNEESQVDAEIRALIGQMKANARARGESVPNE